MPPVPVYVKGGVWSNLEDQIVKAAIQKYGTHQWSKVASLLQKKTAKQCETRWNEYLNPKLNFDQFSKEEDARLLDLARRLPNQWRTIAGAMGRTAQVCIDRYSKLLEGDDVDPELNLGSSLEFKVGDLNPKSDTLAAKPDDVELADDEREMLAEARARLLNTQGKKATRKIRERMLEESKRIAQLQKRRELKQAGVNTTIKKAKKKYAGEIDYNEDVIYEQAPLPGLYDTAREDERLVKDFERFQERVDRKGLENKEGVGNDSKRGQKRRKSQEAVDRLSKATHNSKILTNDYQKPILALPEPGVKRAIVEEDIELKRQHLVNSHRIGPALKSEGTPQYNRPTVLESKVSERASKVSLKDLFASLPKPKNDFEIVLEDETEETGETDQPNTVATSGAAESTYGDDVMEKSNESPKMVPMELECLNQSHLPLPPFIENPKDEFEQVFNELVSISMIKEDLMRPSDSLEYLGQVEDEIKPVELKCTEDPMKDWSFPSRSEMLESIRSKLLRATELQEKLAYIAPIVSRNGKISRKICAEQIPRVRELQHRYYVNYRMYQDELRGIAERKERLKSDLDLATI